MARLSFLNGLKSAEKIPDKDPEQIAQEVKDIVLTYNITVDQLQYCLNNIKIVHEYYYNRLGKRTAAEEMAYYTCINGIIAVLEKKIAEGNIK